MIHLQPIKTEDREIFWNMNQKHLYEMTLYYPDDMDEQGNYHYGYFDAYFTDPNRKAWFICLDDKKIGFVMIHPYSVIGQNPDYTLAEFAVFPAYRRNHYALETAKLIFSSYPGRWELKYNEKNSAAKQLWTLVTAPYHPTVHHLNEVETVLEFSVHT